MSKVKKAFGLSSAAAAILLVLSPVQKASAESSFRFPNPDLESVDSCVRKARGNKTAAADCFDPYDRMCKARYSSRLLECLPQEVAFWRGAVDQELQRVGSTTARLISNSIEGDIREHCNYSNPEYREGCKRMVYNQAAVYLRIDRLWK